MCRLFPISVVIVEYIKKQKMNESQDSVINYSVTRLHTVFYEWTRNNAPGQEIFIPLIAKKKMKISKNFTISVYINTVNFIETCTPEQIMFIQCPVLYLFQFFSYIFRYISLAQLRSPRRQLY